jgi:hypothetical protein
VINAQRDAVCPCNGTCLEGVSADLGGAGEQALDLGAETGGVKWLLEEAVSTVRRGAHLAADETKRDGGGSTVAGRARWHAWLLMTRTRVVRHA